MRFDFAARLETSSVKKRCITGKVVSYERTIIYSSETLYRFE